MEPSLRFPHNLLRFFYWVIFRPFTLRQILEHIDPPLVSAVSLFARGWWTSPTRRSLKLLALFYIGLVPWLAAIGLGMAIASCGMTVNWLTLSFYMLVGIALSLTFSLGFCVAFLTPFSLAVTVFSSSGFILIHALLFSFGLGLAYGLMSKPAKWGLRLDSFMARSSPCSTVHGPDWESARPFWRFFFASRFTCSKRP